MSEGKSWIIGVDFDGTIVKHAYPDIGEPVPYAIDSLKDLAAAGHRILLWTMRDGDRLMDALRYLHGEGVELWAANTNPDQSWSDSPKAYCHVYIDDAALGCPLIEDEDGGRPYVDWGAVQDLLGVMGADAPAGWRPRVEERE